MKQKDLHRWQAPVVGLVGLWLAVSPWVPGLSGGEVALWGRFVLGAALVAAGVAMAWPRTAALAAWSAVVLGMVMVAAPWILDHSDSLAATLNSVAAGSVATVLGFWVGMLATDQDSWWNDRGMAH